MGRADTKRQDKLSARAALSVSAPYVVERLVKDRVADSRSEAEKLFTEVKRYLVLSDVNPDVGVGMYSVRVDEAWHAFILHTTQYAQFCSTYFGRYIAHAPKGAPGAGDHTHQHRREVTFDEFRALYEDFFAEPLPRIWFDIHAVTPARRLFNDSAGSMIVTQRGSITELVDDTGEVVLSADQIARVALEFIARTGAFYVRELPGGLTDDEEVALVQALMSAGTLRLAP